MACCGQHRHPASAAPDAPGAIAPDAPCVLCAEKHFETAYALCSEYGYTDTNRGRAIGELVLCGWHLWKSGHDNLAKAVRVIRGKLQLRRDADVVWHNAAAAIRAAAAAEAAMISKQQPTNKKEA